MWTQFWDMHSGGGQKEDFAKLYIEAPEEEAMRIFEDTYGHHPYNVTCDCCGEDYSVSEYETLEQATAYHRNCRWEGDGYIEEPNEYSDRVIPLEEYLKQPDVAVIRRS